MALTGVLVVGVLVRLLTPSVADARKQKNRNKY